MMMAAFIDAVARFYDRHFQLRLIRGFFVMFDRGFAGGKIHLRFLNARQFLKAFGDIGRAARAVHAGYFKSSFFHMRIHAFIIYTLK